MPHTIVTELTGWGIKGTSILSRRRRGRSHRPIEEAKIACAKKLFASLHSDCVIYEHVNDFQTLLNRVMR